MARSSSPLISALFACLTAAVVFFGISPAFVPSAVRPTGASPVAVAGTAAPAALVGVPLSALADAPIPEPVTDASASIAESAGTPIPEPVIGIGLLSVIVVIVLVISGLVIARGLLDDEVGGEL
mmetsp:Transcript_98061/g.189347  ORF Transcript_98061/g.189347 Transcript_98061/m.189347 type:complete len:124 (-) Transcript_98061:199-570(-)